MSFHKLDCSEPCFINEDAPVFALYPIGSRARVAEDITIGTETILEKGQEGTITGYGGFFVPGCPMLDTGDMIYECSIFWLEPA